MNIPTVETPDVPGPIIGSSVLSEQGAGVPAGYKVGKGRPPKDWQYKPGQSGNPRGRPKGSLNKSTILRNVLNEKVALPDGDKSRLVSKSEAVIQALTAKAMEGNPRASSVLFDLEDRLGLLGGEEGECDSAKRVRPSDALLEGVDPSQLAAEERAELSRLVALFERGIVALSAEQLTRLQALIAKSHTGTLH